jgi:hypothetical protein
MEAVCSSEKLVNYWTTWHYILEDSTSQPDNLFDKNINTRRKIHNFIYILVMSMVYNQTK